MTTLIPRNHTFLTCLVVKMVDAALSLPHELPQIRLMPLNFLRFRWRQRRGMLAASTAVNVVYTMLLPPVLKQYQCW